PLTALTAILTLSCCAGLKHAVPRIRHGMRSSRCDGSDGLKDSRIESDSSTATVIRGSCNSGRRMGGGDGARDGVISPLSEAVVREPCKASPESSDLDGGAPWTRPFASFTGP